MGRFQIIVLTVSFFLLGYLGYRLTPVVGIGDGPIWILLLLCFLLVLSLPFYFWSRLRGEMSSAQKRLMGLTRLGMAYLNFLIPVVVIRDVVSGFARYLAGQNVDSWFSPIGNLILLLFPFLLLLWGTFTIFRGPQTIRRELKDERLPKSLDGFRILHISDLHISSSLKPGFIEKVLAKSLEINADLIALTGDIVDGSPVEFQKDIQKLSGLKASSGVWFVPGNHEYYWNFPEIHPELEKAGLQVLINQGQAISRGQANEELWIGGIPDPAARQFGQEPPQFDKLSPHFRSSGQYRVLLSHQPVLADAASETGFHLQLSGHTHAGQFFPWNYLIGFFQKYAIGFYKIGGLHLYVNQGTGYWGPALRVGTVCEMTEITLRA